MHVDKVYQLKYALYHPDDSTKVLVEALQYVKLCGVHKIQDPTARIEVVGSNRQHYVKLDVLRAAVAL